MGQKESGPERLKSANYFKCDHNPLLEIILNFPALGENRTRMCRGVRHVADLSQFDLNLRRPLGGPAAALGKKTL
jgi:hypothetical protein